MDGSSGRTSIDSDAVRVVVATVVHRSDDARIFHRQVSALLDAGNEVVLLAPGPSADSALQTGLRHRVVQRSTGRRRLRALFSMARVLLIESRRADLTIIHDPELVLLAPWIRSPRIWDVHEDLVAQVEDKDWVPGRLQPLARGFARLLEWVGARCFAVVVAEDGYRNRFEEAPVVRNLPVVPATVRPTGSDRVVYLGRVSHGRGLEVLLEVARLMDGECAVEVVGPLDPGIEQGLFDRTPGVVYRGPRPNPEALDIIEGSRAGLCLLEDLPNYRHSMPTKVLEYMARGLPVITTPNPEASRLVLANGCGLVVPFGDPRAVVDAIRELDDPFERGRLAENGRRAVSRSLDWKSEADRFVSYCEEIAGG